MSDSLTAVLKTRTYRFLISLLYVIYTSYKKLEF